MDFSYKASITVDHTKVPTSDQTDFPILVSGTYDGTGGKPNLKSVGNSGNVQHSSGYDIYFYSDSSLTTRIPAEREKYVNTSGEIIFWVKNTVTTGSDTVIYIAYGDSGISTDPNSDGTYGKTSTWNSAFKGVHHLGTGSSMSLDDSTSNGNTLTDNWTNISGTTGEVYGGANFSAYPKALIRNYGLGTQSQFTAECWINPSVVNGWQNIMFFGDNRWYIWESAFRLFSTNAGWAIYGPATSTSTWYHVAVTFNSTAIAMYINGTAYTGSSTSALVANTMYYGFDDSARQYYGVMDELRISTTNRTTSWIQTEYNNINSPSTFYTMGSETAVGGSSSSSSSSSLSSSSSSSSLSSSSSSSSRSSSSSSSSRSSSSSSSSLSSSSSSSSRSSSSSSSSSSLSSSSSSSSRSSSSSSSSLSSSSSSSSRSSSSSSSSLSSSSSSSSRSSSSSSSSLSSSSSSSSSSLSSSSSSSSLSSSSSSSSLSSSSSSSSRSSSSSSSSLSSSSSSSSSSLSSSSSSSSLSSSSSSSSLSSSSSSSSRSSSSSSSGSSQTKVYTRGDEVTLPTGTTDLETGFSAQDYLDVATDNNVFVCQTATDQYVEFLWKNQNTNNTDSIAPIWIGKTDRDASLSTVYLQIYNRTTPAWETLATNTTATAGAKFTISGMQSSSLNNYYDASNWVACRIYQNAI